MQNKFKKIMILALLGLMLASAAVPVVSTQPHKAQAAKQESVTFAVSPNPYFQRILTSTASIAPINTTWSKIYTTIPVRTEKIVALGIDLWGVLASPP